MKNQGKTKVIYIASVRIVWKIFGNLPKYSHWSLLSLCQLQNFKPNKFLKKIVQKGKYGNIPTIFSDLHENTSQRLALVFSTEAYHITQYLHFLIGISKFNLCKVSKLLAGSLNCLQSLKIDLSKIL